MILFHSQIELRLIAHFSGDTELIRAIGGHNDVFDEMARVWLNMETVTPDDRRKCKAICYGLMYGSGNEMIFPVVY